MPIPIQDTPIKGTPTAVRIPKGYNFAKAKFTIDVVVNDQDGNPMMNDSVPYDLETDIERTESIPQPDGTAKKVKIVPLLSQADKDKLIEVAKIIYRAIQKIN